MERRIAVLFFPDAVAENPASPLMLSELLFCPVLSWVALRLQEQGVEQFYAVCDTYTEELQNALPAETVLLSFAEYATELPKRLQAQAQVTVITAPAVPAGFYSGGVAFACSGEALSAVLNRCGELSALPEPSTACNGFVPFGDAQELAELSLLCRDAIVKEHQQNGVLFLDPTAVYIDPRVKIGAGTRILPGTILRGNTTIGTDCEIGPQTMLQDSSVGDKSRISTSQAEASIIGTRCTVGPFVALRHQTVADDTVQPKF